MIAANAICSALAGSLPKRKAMKLSVAGTNGSFGMWLQCCEGSFYIASGVWQPSVLAPIHCGACSTPVIGIGVGL